MANTEPTAEAPQSGTERDIFTDPALHQRIDDPVLNFLKKNGKSILVTVLAVVAVLYIRTALTSSYQNSMKESADSFNKVRVEYEALKTQRAKIDDLTAQKTAKDFDKKSAEDKKKIEDDLAGAQKEFDGSRERLTQFLAVLGDARDPYPEMAKIYRALTAKLSGDMAGMKSALQAFKPETIGKEDSREGFFTELALLSLAKGLIDSPEGLADARAQLKLLAEKGFTVAVPAALTLARISVTKDEKAEALSTLLVVQGRQPEQAKLLEDEIKRAQ